MERCPWCEKYELYRRYHDEEWGVPEYVDRQLFEKLLLDGAQAGLSWWTILNKRENYRQAFDRFDPYKMASYGDDKIHELLNNPGIVRNKLKVKAAVSNARAYLELMSKGPGLSNLLWGFVDGQPIVNQFRSLDELPASTELSDKMSKTLKQEGFKFVGTTIVYAFMQAVGIVNDHLVECPRHLAVQSFYR